MTDNKDRINQSQFLKYLVILLSNTTVDLHSLIVQDLKTLLVRNASLCPAAVLREANFILTIEEF